MSNTSEKFNFGLDLNKLSYQMTPDQLPLAMQDLFSVALESIKYIDYATENTFNKMLKIAREQNYRIHWELADWMVFYMSDHYGVPSKEQFIKSLLKR